MMAKERLTPRHASRVKGPDAEPTFKCHPCHQAQTSVQSNLPVQATQTDSPLCTVTQTFAHHIPLPSPTTPSIKHVNAVHPLTKQLRVPAYDMHALSILNTSS
jgi:hypothetical protein